MTTLLQKKPVQEYPHAYFQYVDYGRVQHKDLFLDFIEWHVQPREMRTPKTQGEYALMNGLSMDTLTDWKKRDGFETEVQYRRIQFFREYTTDICYALVQKALTGNTAAVRLFLRLFEGFER